MHCLVPKCCALIWGPTSESINNLAQDSNKGGFCVKLLMGKPDFFCLFFLWLIAKLPKGASTGSLKSGSVKKVSTLNGRAAVDTSLGIIV